MDEDVDMLNGQKKKSKKDKKKKKKKEKLTYAAPFHTQVGVLLQRTWKTIWRENVNLKPFLFLIVITQRRMAAYRNSFLGG
jgi:hypothetical protein